MLHVEEHKTVDVGLRHQLPKGMMGIVPEPNAKFQGIVMH